MREPFIKERMVKEIDQEMAILWKRLDALHEERNRIVGKEPAQRLSVQRVCVYAAYVILVVAGTSFLVTLLTQWLTPEPYREELLSDFVILFLCTLCATAVIVLGVGIVYVVSPYF